MIDFPIADLMDDTASIQWLEQHLHPNGLHCPHCGSANRRVFRPQEYFDAYRCRDCDGYYTILTGTAFAKTQQAPSTLVLLVRGVAKGEPTARLARELGLSRQTVHTLRQRVQSILQQQHLLVPEGVSLREQQADKHMLEFPHSDLSTSSARSRHTDTDADYTVSAGSPQTGPWM